MKTRTNCGANGLRQELTVDSWSCIACGFRIAGEYVAHAGSPYVAATIERSPSLREGDVYVFDPALFVPALTIK